MGENERLERMAKSQRAAEKAKATKARNAPMREQIRAQEQQKVFAAMETIRGIVSERQGIEFDELFNELVIDAENPGLFDWNILDQAVNALAAEKVADGIRVRTEKKGNRRVLFTTSVGS